MERSSLCVLYGTNVMTEIMEHIDELKKNSNIPFDNKYLELGIQFLIFKANKIVKDVKPKPLLKNLISESFGEAAIYQYNCCNGRL
jgi:hypothetical protein